MGSKYNNPSYIGKQYGWLTVEEIEYSEKLKKYLWRCRCKCSKETIADPYKVVVSKEIKSCGCYRSSLKLGLTRREYQRQYMKKLRQWNKEHGLCVYCGKKDAYTMNGHAYCFECCAKRRITPYEAIKEEKDEIPKIPRLEWNSYGLCSHCGKKPIKEGIRPYANVPYKVCEECYQHMLKMRAAYKQKNGDNIRYIYPPHDNTTKAIETYRKLLNDQKERRRLFDDERKGESDKIERKG